MILFRKIQENCTGDANRDSLRSRETLYKLCSHKVEELIYHACKNIQWIYGDYDEEKCRQKVEDLQEYIVANLPAIVFDDLCNIRQMRVKPQNEDIRIELALYIHKNMRKFFIKHFIKPTNNLECTFWATQFSKLQNLVVLDLNLFCTDEILEIVSENCPKLAYIDIVSQVEAMNFKKWRSYHFNALKLKYRISDVGLGYLCKCKLLRKISMNKIFRSHCGGELVTLAGIRRLVKSLPLLQHITFEDMGMVLAEEMEDIRHLSLMYLSDFHPQPAHLNIISRLCPDLKHLHLRLPSINDAHNKADILLALALSNLKVSELQLVGFSFCSKFSLVIETKGCYLKSLSIENFGSITSETIQLIGRACPNLMTLHLSEEQCPAVDTFSWFNSEYFDIYSAEGGIFGKLQYLTLAGIAWNLNDILPLCLTSAKGLRMLKIFNQDDPGSLDLAIRQITKTNSLQELRTVCLWTHARLTIRTPQYLFRNCPRLRELLFLKSDNVTQQQINALKSEMQKEDFIMFTSGLNLALLRRT